MAFTPPKLTESFEYEGYWWLPDDPDKEVSGVIKYDPEEGISLRLSGSFYDTENPFRMYEQLPQSLDLIEGWLIESSRAVTLFECLMIEANQHLPGYPILKYRISYMFVGDHHVGLAAQFSTMSVEYTSLGDWLRVQPFEVTFDRELDENGKITNIEAIAKYVMPKFNVINLDSLNATLQFKSILDRIEFSPQKIDWTNTVSASLEADTAKNFEWFLFNAISIERLLALLIGEPVFIRLFQLQQIEAQAEDRQSTLFNVYYAAVYSAREESSAWYDMLTTAPFIGMDRVAIAFQVWFRKAEYLRTFANLYLSTRYRKFFPELVLLTLTQALEGYHRQRFEGQYLTDEEYQPFRETLISAIPKSMPSDMQQSLQNRLKYGNEFSLRRRLKDLKNQLSEDLQRCIAKKSFNDFIDYVVKARNQHAHQLTVEQPLESLTGGQLFWANERLGIWITILVFKELGIPDELIVEAIPHNKQYAYLLNKSPDGR